MQFANAVLSGINGNLCCVDLQQQALSPLTEEALSLRERALEKNDFSAFSLARQFAEADTIVIAAPYWDLSFPASLKTYFEHICIPGITFRYLANGMPESLCRAGRLIYITTAGGFIGNCNFGYDYVSALAKNLFGIKEVRCLSAEGLDIDGADVAHILNQAARTAMNHI